jgi:(R,R)-butanediol dehydrogenase/meso-butanediol dehydrogenase/diacetyl reductase
MRAVRWYAPGDVRVDNVPEPAVGPRDVKVRVGYNGICCSDLHEFYDTPFMVPTHPHALTGICAPVTLGHETGGRVVETGPEVEDLDAGALVAIEPIIACGECPACWDGEYNFCARMAFHGFSAATGGMAEITVVDRSMVHVLPDSLSDVHAALVEPMAVAAHAVGRSGAGPGDLVVVHGAGPIGLGAMFALHALGAEVVVSEPSPTRRDEAARHGARATLDPTTDDVVAAVEDLSGGRRARASIDAVGVQQSFTAALCTTGRHGTVVLVGVPRAPLRLDHRHLFNGGIQIRGSVAYCGDFPTVIDGMARGFYPTDWVSVMPMGDVIDAFTTLHEGQAAKILLDPHAESTRA